MFSIFTHVMKRDTNSHLGLHVVKEEKLSSFKVWVRRYVCYRLSGAYGYKIVDSHKSRSCKRFVIYVRVSLVLAI